jgi:hypothetical protein
MTIFQAVPNPLPEVTAESLDDEVIIDDILMDDVVDESEDLGLGTLTDEFAAPNASGIDKSGEGNFFEDSDNVDVVIQEELVDESWANDLLEEQENEPAPAPPKSHDANNIDDFADEIQLKQTDDNDLGFDQNDKSSLLNRITPEPLELKVVRDHSGIVNFLLSLSFVVFLLAAIAQTLYFQVDTLGRKPELRSTYQVFCQLAQCTLPEQFSIKDISAANTHQKQHNVYQDALTIDTVITNHAKFRQPFPHIEVYFKNMQDKVIAARSFEPNDYLRGAIATSKTMPVRQPIHLVLELDDPGSKATGYEIKLSYPN